MTAQADINLVSDRIMISGDLNFAMVNEIYAKSLVLFPQLQELQIDFSQVSTSNSAALALMIEWLRYAKQPNKQIHFVKVPEQLKAIAAAAGVDSLI